MEYFGQSVVSHLEPVESIEQREAEDEAAEDDKDIVKDKE